MIPTRPITFGFAVPVKTGAAFLPFALRSLEQQLGVLEVALVDASGDPAVRALAERYQKIIRYRRHASSDAGQSAAIQEGWDHIGGEILGWLNADDGLMPGALDSVAAIFTAREDVDVVYGHAVYLDENGGFQTYFPSLSPDASALRRSNVICQPACFVRRAAVARVGGLDTSLRFTMDWDLWLRLYDAGCHFHFLARPLAAVINHGATKTNTGGAARYGEIDRILRRHAGIGARLAAQIGHRRTDASSTGGLAGRAVEAAMRLAGIFLPRKRPEPVFGIEPESNRVNERCSIALPWYRDGLPSTMCLAISPAGHPQATCNGTSLALKAGASAGSWTARLPPSEAGLYEFDIEQPGSWTLNELRIL
jgi:hypothetical protein